MTRGKLSVLMESYLASGKVPSEPPIQAQERQVLPVVPTERWSVVDRKRLVKTFSFETVGLRNQFVATLFRLEEECGHHAELLVDENTVRVKLWTRSSDSLSELDKEYARVADAIYRDVTCPIPSVYLGHSVG